jgi:hypothetical protein
MNTILEIKISQFFYSMRKPIVIGAIIGFIVVVSWIFAVKNEYRATALHQVAAFNGKDIISPLSLSEQLKITGFFSESTLGICAPNNGGTFFRFDSKVHKIIPSVVIVSVDASSPELARDCLVAMLVDIDGLENARVQTSIESIKTRSALIKNFSNSMGKFSSVESATFTFLAGMKMVDDLYEILNVRPPVILFGDITVERVSKLTQLNFLKAVLGALFGSGLLTIIFMIRIRY